MPDIQDFISDLDSAQGYISDVMSELENFDDDKTELEEHRDAFVQILRIVLKSNADIFDEDDPQSFLDLLVQGQAHVDYPNMLIAFAQGYKAAVDKRSYFYYVNKLRETLTQLEKENAEKNEDPSDPSGSTP